MNQILKTVSRILPVLIPGIFLLTCTVQGQEDDLPVEEVEVIKNFEARLAEADKLDVHPEFPPLDTTIEAYEYTLGTYDPGLDYIDPDIRPLAMSREKSLKGYNHYLKGGYGFPNQTFFRGGFHKSKRGNEIDVEARHQSANEKAFDHKKYMENELNASFQFPLNRNMSLQARAGYRLDRRYYYGYDHSDTTIAFSDDEAQKQFNAFQIGLGIKNDERLSGDINYSAQLNFHQLKDDLATRENSISLDLSGEKYFSEQHPLRIQIESNFTDLRDTLERSLNNFHLQPDFTYHGDHYQLQGGIRISSSDDDFYFFPVAEFKIQLSGPQLIGFVGAKGNLHKNSYHNLTEYNPYITERLDTLANSKYYDFYGGVTGRFRGLTYELTGSFKSVEDLALFLPMENDQRKFTTEYDDGNITEVSARISYAIAKKLRFSLGASKNIYSLDREVQAWHLPRFELDLNTTFTSRKRKLRLQGGISLASGVYTQNAEGNEKQIGGLFDLSLAADYFFTESFGAFLHLNNIANDDWQRWERYPTFGINAVGGLQLRF